LGNFGIVLITTTAGNLQSKVSGEGRSCSQAFGNIAGFELGWMPLFFLRSSRSSVHGCFRAPAEWCALVSFR
jgi:hypothetical protein